MALIEIPVNELTPFDLPRVCVMTGASEGFEFQKVKFQWHPRWVFFLLIINVIVMAIVAQVTRKQCAGELAFTPQAWQRWQRWKWGSVGSALGVVFGFIAGLVLLAKTESAIGAVVMLAGVIQFIVVGVLARQAGPQVQSIQNDILWLKVPSDEVARLYAEHLRGSPAA